MMWDEIGRDGKAEPGQEATFEEVKETSMNGALLNRGELSKLYQQKTLE